MRCLGFKARLEPPIANAAFAMKARAIEDVHDLSPLQEGILFQELAEPGLGAYLNQTSYELVGELDEARFQAAWAAVARRHPALRSSFHWQGLKRPQQVVHREIRLPLSVEDWSQLGTEEVARRRVELVDERRTRRFDPTAAPLWQVDVRKLGPARTLVLWSRHHLLMDGWSSGIVLRELASAYAMGDGEGAGPLGGRGPAFRDYVEFVRQRDRERSEAHWRRRVGDVQRPSLLPFGGRGNGNSLGCRRVVLTIEPQIWQRITQAAAKRAIGPAALVGSAWAAVLSTSNPGRDVVFGVTVSGRTADVEGVERMVGVLANTLPLRVVGGPDTSWMSRAEAVQSDSRADQEFVVTPLAEIVGCTRLPAGRPLFDSVLIYEQFGGDEAEESPDAESAPEPPTLGVENVEHHALTHFPATVVASPKGAGLELVLLLGDRFYGEAGASKLAALVRAAFVGMAEEPDASPSALADLGRVSRHQLRHAWNDTRTATNLRPGTVADVASEQAAVAPGRVALVGGGRHISYGCLGRLVQLRSERLRSVGVRRGDVVGLVPRDRVQWCIDTLAVWRVGAAAVALDPAYPKARLRQMVEDVRPRIVLDEERDDPPADPLRVDAESGSVVPHDSADDVAYLVFTSGSTGVPKASLGHHAGLLNHALAYRDRLGLRSTDRVVQFASPSFDAALSELGMTMIAGGTLVTLESTERHQVAAAIERLRITTATLPPTLLSVTEASWRAVRILLAAGEVCRPDVVRKFAAGRALYNAYGPSEASVGVSLHRCRVEDQGEPPLGRPLDNVRLHVLGADGRLVGPGVEGEIHVGGIAVGYGYHGRPRRTAAAFGPDPFSKTGGARLYATGDRGWHREDGAIGFAGRIDRQVELRGHRVELGDIEACARRSSRVSEAVAQLRGPAGTAGRQLVLYWRAAAGEAPLETAELKKQLAQGLPAYMVPAQFVRVAEFPRSVNGKIDERRLPAPPAEQADVADGVASRNDPETKLIADVWSTVLDRKRVGLDDDFFELGGNSLVAMQLVGRLSKVFGAALEVGDLFVAPTVRQLAQRMRTRSGAPKYDLPLVRLDGGDSAPLSPMQRQLWTMEASQGAGSLYATQVAVSFRGSMQRRRFERAVGAVVEHQDVLRTRLESVGDQLRQTTVASTEFAVARVDLRACPQDSRDATCRALVDGARRRGFALHGGELFRATVFVMADDLHVVVFDVHHGVWDGWSVGVFARQLERAYRGDAPRPGDPGVRYRDFARWQEQRLAVMRAPLREYWAETLRGAPATSTFPADDPQADPTGLAQMVRVDLEPELVARMRRTSLQQGLTLHMLLFAAVGVTLGSMSARTDVVLGTPVAGRDRPVLEDLVGSFAQAVPLRLRWSGEDSAESLLKRCRSVALGAVQHGALPFEEIAATVDQPPAPRGNPLFQVMVALQNMPLHEARFGGLELEPFAAAPSRARFDLEFVFVDHETIAGTLVFPEGRYTQTSIRRIIAGFRRVVGALTEPARSRQPLRSDIAIPRSLRHQIRREWAGDVGGVAAPPSDLWTMFARVAAARPEVTALELAGGSVSYGALEARAARWGAEIRARLQVGDEPRVAVMLPRGTDQICGLLATWFAGAAAVPIDVGAPIERRRRQLESSNAGLVVAESDAHAIAVERVTPDVLDHGCPVDPRRSAVPASSLAYTMFTSGTSGEPKQVAIEHRNILAHLDWHLQSFPDSSRRRFHYKTPSSFDLALWEVLVPLAHGATVVVAPSGHETDVELLGRGIERHRVEVVHVLPSMLGALRDSRSDLTTIRRTYCGGDVLSPSDARTWRVRTRSTLVHMYGPTECTVAMTWFRGAGVGRSLPIGRPIGGATAFVVADGDSVPTPGCVGELWIGGDVVGRGYVGDPRQTASRFVPDALSGGAGTRLYRTGDRCTHRGDGNLLFLGRADDQLKRRGLRIEPAEITATLLEHPEVDGAVLVPRHDGKRSVLVAYWVPRTDADRALSSVRTHVSELLPRAMHPDVYVAMKSLPLTRHGKIDVAALPDPEFSRARRQAPRSEVEASAMAVWCRVLGVDAVDDDSEFFALGGHSMNATEIVVGLRDELALSTTVMTLFEQPRFGDFVRVLERAWAAGASGGLSGPAQIAAAEPAGPSLPTFAQERLWILDKLEGGNASYNVPLPLLFRGRLNPNALHRAFEALVLRHEALRTRFVVVDDRPVQDLLGLDSFQIAWVDLRVAGAPKDDVLRRLRRSEAKRPFDLARGPLIRVSVVLVAPEEAVLLLTLHHVICDGWSMSVLYRELSALYDAECHGRASELPPISVQLRHFARWERDEAAAGRTTAEVEYWREQLEGSNAQVTFPGDRPRPAVRGTAGDFIRTSIPDRLTERLREVASRHGTTLYPVLLAGFSVLLARHTGHHDLCVGTAMAGRDDPDAAGLVGFFVNTVVLRMRADPHASIDALVEQARQTVLQAHRHQQVPFDQLVAELGAEPDLGYNPLFQVMFALQNAPPGRLRLDGVEVTALIDETQTTKFDLMVSVTESAGSLSVNFQYSTDLYDASTITRIGHEYRQVLQRFAGPGDLSFSDVSTLQPPALHQQLREWNDVADDLVSPHAVHTETARWARRRPGGVAIDAKEGQVSYGELDRRARVVAAQLASRGVGPGEKVGLIFERGRELPVAVLGVAYAGAAYVPLDPRAPAARIEHIVGESGCSAIVSDSASLQQLGALGVDLPAVLVGPEHQTDGQAEAGIVDLGPESVAYVAYTSGSTGQPKGIEVPHRGIERLVRGAPCVASTSRRRWSQVASPAFDAFTLELWGAWFHGARLCVATKEEVLQPLEFRRFLTRTRADALWLTTSLYRLFAEFDPSMFGDVHELIVGGEALDYASAQRVLGSPRPPRSMWNGYGPTETTTFATVARISIDEPRGLVPPIGRPIGDTSVYVLDAQGQPCPIGTTGELQIAGAGVAHGYANQARMTAERFVPDPFSPQGGQRMYRSGDLVRFRNDGRLEFVGRKDGQVKLRGQRIEVGEIEAVLGEHPAVRRSAVRIRSVRGEPALVSFVVLDAQEREARADVGEGDLVSNWETLFDQLYDGAKPEGEAFEFVGWHSSYTGEALPPAHMREWLDETMARLRAIGGRRVLEIGCGTGMLMRRLAPSCEHYTATDFSQAVLDRLAPEVDSERDRWGGHVDLVRAVAHEVGGREQRYDLVVLNSVAQYFPGGEYLERVVRAAIDVATPGGRIFVGDLRNGALAEPFYLSVEHHRCGPGATYAELWERARGRARVDEELMIDPEFFAALAAEHPRVAGVEICPKWGRHDNEMTRYRYDVVLLLDRAQEASDAVTTLRWGEDVPDIEALREWLQRVPDILEVRGVPERIAADVRHHREATRSPRAVPGRLDGEGSTAAFDLGAVRDVARTMGCEARLFWCPGTPPGTVAVRIASRGPSSRCPAPKVESGVGPRLLASLTSRPLRVQSERRIVPLLRGHLRARVPEYMIPAHFVQLDALPLTVNGKIDEAALPTVTRAAAPDRVVAATPGTPTSEVVGAIWAAVLGLETVTPEQDFFELGGHSLLATRVLTRVRQALDVELPLRTLFEHSTLAGFANAVERQLVQRRGTARPPVEVLPRGERTPASFAQERLWFLAQLEPANVAYNMSGGMRLRGALDRDAMRGAVEGLVARHEGLRTRFVSEEGRPYQVIVRRPFRVATIDVSGVEQPVVVAESVARALSLRPYDLQEGPLFHATVVSMGSDEHMLLMMMHHIVSDGWSIGVLVGELAQLYNSSSLGQESTLEDVPVQYADFAAWQRKWLSEEALQEQVHYWEERLQGAPSVCTLPPDRSRPKLASFRGGAFPVALDRDTTTRLRTLANEERATLYMVLLAAFESTLYRFTGQTDIVVGSPIAGRTEPGLERTVGFFVNTLAMRVDVSGNPKFRELVRRVRRTCVDAYVHQDVPFERLVSTLVTERDLGRNPVFQVMFALQNVPGAAAAFRGLSIEPLRQELDFALFDLELQLNETPHGVVGRVSYDRTLFDETTIRRFVEHWKAALAIVACDPQSRIDEVALLSASQRHLLGVEGRAGPAPIGSAALVHEVVAERAAEQPHRLALVGRGVRVSYGALVQRAREVALGLLELGLVPGDAIAVDLPRGSAQVTAILASLFTGAMAVPLDSRHPLARKRAIVSDCGARWVVTVSDEPTSVAQGGRGISVSRLHRLGRTSARALPRLRPEQVAYIMYTSGSTGKPKGVAIHHRAFAAHLVAVRRRLSLSSRDRGLYSASAGFDLALWQIFAALTNGGSLVVPDAALELDVDHLIESMVREGVTTLHCTPTLLDALVQRERIGEWTTAHTVVCGGEALSNALAERWLERVRGSLFHMYGPTECAVATTLQEVSPRTGSERAQVPIGRSIETADFACLGPCGAETPIGALGEIHIGGPVVGTGYFGDPRQTATAFVPDPRPGRTGERMYRTGDLGRVLADGRLVFEGRRDRQRKLRGQRIELGEIEAVLRSHAGVAEASVDLVGPESAVVAFVVASHRRLDDESKTRAAEAEHIAAWTEIFDRQSSDEQDEFHGWNSSHTGAPIPRAQMELWRDEIIERIEAGTPRRVLEVGCGSGLLLRRLAAGAERYVGTDPSSQALLELRDRIRGQDLSQVELRCESADALSSTESFDTVILNSVTQYFPSPDYLRRVVERALDRVAPGGRLVIGDVRHLGTLPAFALALELANAPGSTTVESLRESVVARLFGEEELVVDPWLFHVIAGAYSRPCTVEVLLKTTAVSNEMRDHRYDVIVHLDREPPRTHEIDASLLQGTDVDLVGALRACAGAPVSIAGLPHLWVHRDLALWSLVEDPERLPRGSKTTVARLVEMVDSIEHGLDPQWRSRLTRCAAQAGYTVRWECAHQSAGAGASLWPVSGGLDGPHEPCARSASLPEVGRPLTNRPLRARERSRLVLELREHVRDHVPLGVAPSAIICIEHLPMTVNGKLDREALRRLAQASRRIEPRDGHQAPVGEVEQLIATLWQDALQIVRVGRKDDFFALGGHSLLVTQVVSRLRDQLGIALELRDFLEAPVLEAFAGRVQRALDSARLNRGIEALAMAPERPEEFEEVVL